MVVVRARRRVSAWALPRPSAMASAKLAKTTVNHSQMATASTKKISKLSWVRVQRRRGLGEEQAHELDGGDHAAHLHHEHDRVLDLHARVELLERLRDGGADDLGVPDRDVSLAARLPLLHF